jgi:hypothetical protein
MAGKTPKTSEQQSGQQATAEDRRRSPRFPSDLDTVCRPLVAGEAASWPGRLLDISQNGLAVVLHRRFEPGALLTMDLEDHGRTVRRSIFARVIHIRAHESGGWRLGCAFSGELTDAELEAFRAHRARPGGDDSRAWVRFECDVPTICRDADHPDNDPVAARILNIAPGGLALLASTRWRKGNLLWLQFPGAPERPGRSVLVRVAESPREAGELWMHSCEFAFQLGEEDLQGLLQ